MNNEKMNSEIKLSNNSSFVILIFVTLKFRNISRSLYIPSFQIFTPTQLIIWKLANFPNYKFFKLLNLEIFGWDTNYRMIKCRTTGVSKCQNYEY